MHKIRQDRKKWKEKEERLIWYSCYSYIKVNKM